MVSFNFCFQENPLGRLTWKLIKLAKGILPSGKWFPVGKTQVQIPSVTFTSCDPTSLPMLAPSEPELGLSLALLAPQWPSYWTFSFTFRTNRLCPWLPPYAYPGRTTPPFHQIHMEFWGFNWPSDTRVKKSHHHAWHSKLSTQWANRQAALQETGGRNAGKEGSQREDDWWNRSEWK